MFTRVLAATAAFSLALLGADLNSTLFDRLEYRSIGPASMGGRVTDVEGVPGRPELVYVATASGGLFKTVNGGTTWTPIFDHEHTISIGNIAVDPQNPDVVWLGAGEANARNSVSFGDGVYKTLDGGKTWRNLGLRDTHHISRVALNPLNPNIAYVCALGHNTGPNDERGVFMTTDGGDTWKKTLYIDADHGCADMDIDQQNPNILYATMWKFLRRPWTFTSGSEKTGVFRSLDGGRTWAQLTTGLPKGWGRIGVRVAPSNPNVVYVIGESNEGTIYRSDDRGDHFHFMTKNPAVVGRGLYYSHLTIDPTDENRIYTIGMRLSYSIDGGRTIRPASPSIHGDYHTVWVDPKNPARLWLGCDGGIAVSYDRSENWEWVGNLPIGQFYQVFADNREPFYYLSGGLQDNGSWTGPSRTHQGSILNSDWTNISGGDGFHVVVNLDQPWLYLSESQGGGLVRTDLRTHEQQDVSPQPRRNDGGPVGELKYRFNWNAPVVLSPHDHNTVYFGSNVVFKSTDFGKTWTAISPDLTTNDPEKQKSVGTVWTENTTAEYHCTIIRIAESPVQAGVIWAGTDDGNLQLTRDGGKSWTNLTGNAPGVPKFSEIAWVEPSRTAAGTAYVAFENHWFDDFHPYIFKTTDFGKTFTNLTGNLPQDDYLWVVKEDPKNPKVLYAGGELGLNVSFTGGSQWVAMGLGNMPPVAVRDITIHPRDNDLIVATHGRSLWIFDDVTPLQEMNDQVVNDSAYLFSLRPELRFDGGGGRGGGVGQGGNKPFAGPNPPYGAPITYYLKESGPAKVEVLDEAGKLVRDLGAVLHDAGLNRVVWDLRYEGPHARTMGATADAAAGGGFGFPARGPLVLPGKYTIRLTAGGKTLTRELELKLDPTIPVTSEALHTQLETNLKLRDMQSSVNDALRGIDSYKGQIETAQKTVRALDPQATRMLASLLSERLQQLSTMELKLTRPTDIPGYSMGPRLEERLSALLSEIDRVLSSPTPYEMEYFNELRTEFLADVGDVNKFIEKQIPEINDMLKKNNAGALMAGKPVDIPATVR
ncbi:MAG TPA: hypothetical protein VHW09_00100 [Bryobacteraceae bacterium]|jgi:photosystem II stability/assembly factor-like uncharacterized protein|nr:hypothetical protein [Bryobacteraceae bacterium]